MDQQKLMILRKVNVCPFQRVNWNLIKNAIATENLNEKCSYWSCLPKGSGILQNNFFVFIIPQSNDIVRKASLGYG